MVGGEWLLVVCSCELRAGRSLHGCESAIVLTVNRHVLIANRWVNCHIFRELRWMVILFGEGSVVGDIETHMSRVEVYVDLEIERINAIGLSLRVLWPIDHI